MSNGQTTTPSPDMDGAAGADGAAGVAGDARRLDGPRSGMLGGQVGSLLNCFLGFFLNYFLTWRGMVIGLCVMTAARLIYLAWLCPYTLVEDEAFYWEWSRRLELSYYTKGPGIAWTIAATAGIFGDTEFGVRAASPVMSGLTALCIAVLTRKITRSVRAAVCAALAFVLVPLFQVLGLLMTIDGPYALCWALAALLAWMGLKERKGWALALLGFVLGVGFLYKYTILLAVPGIVAAWWFTRDGLVAGSAAGSAASRGRGMVNFGWIALSLALGLVLFGAAVSPVIVWNVREGWPTVAHLLGHLGLAGGDTQVTQSASKGYHYDPMWTLSFIGTQIGMIGPVLALMVLGLLRVRREETMGSHVRTGGIFCFWVGAPLLAFYLLVSFVAEPEGNWALATYLTWFPLAGLAIDRGMKEWKAKLVAWRALPKPRPKQGFFVRRPETVTQVMWYATIVVGLVTLVGMPLLVPLARLGEVAGKNDTTRKFVPDWAYIPTGRFTGGREMGAHADRLMRELYTETGRDPFVMAMHYGRAAQLAFYMPSKPVVYCVSSLVGGRKTQYDYWDDTNVRLQSKLLDRPAVVIGSADPMVWQPHFEQLKLVGKLDGEGKRNRPAYLGYGFRGFDGVPRRVVGEQEDYR